MPLEEEILQPTEPQSSNSLSNFGNLSDLKSPSKTLELPDETLKGETSSLNSSSNRQTVRSYFFKAAFPNLTQLKLT
jgi:hypothetical protein